MLFIYWTAWCFALSIIVCVNASLLESRKLPAACDKKCQHSSGATEIGPSQQGNSGDDGANKRCDDAGKRSRLQAGVRASSTVTRKQFHVIALAMFVPGLLIDASLLRVASSCALVVLVMLEVGSVQTISL